MIVVAPHPDDEVLGASAVLTDAPVTVVHVTDGVPPGPPDPVLAATRRAEAGDAHRLLGADVDDVIRFGLGDQRVTDDVDGVAAMLVELVRERPGSAVYVPAYQRGHPDHDAVNVAAHLARAVASGARWHVYALYGLTDDGAPRMGELGPEHTDGRRSAAGEPDALERKARALRAFASQAPDESVLSSWLREPVPEQYAALPSIAGGLPARRCFYDEVFEFRQFGIDPDAVTARLTDVLARAGLVTG